MIKIGFGIATIVLAAVLTGCGGLGTGTNGNPEVMKHESPTPSDDAAPSAPVMSSPANTNNGMSTGAPSATPTQNPPANH
jgi:hypothetical protein